MEEYFEAKALLFAEPLLRPSGDGAAAVINSDDPWGARLAERLGGRCWRSSLQDASVELFIDDLDDYSAIMFKALADRLAEAFAEALHHRVRTDLWGYAAAESLDNEAMIKEQYRGIRPAPGYPACPDHSVKGPMFDLLQCEEIGMGLTESLAMLPAASVSGFYIGHPDSTYFNVGKIAEDQLQDLAQRRGMDLGELQRLLAPNL